MSILIHPDPVPLRIDETGTIRVGNTRVTLDVLMEDVQAGYAPEEIVRRMDTLTLADVYGALAYYHRHRAELDEYLRQGNEAADKLQQQIEATDPAFRARMKAKLEAFKAQRDAAHASPAE